MPIPIRPVAAMALAAALWSGAAAAQVSELAPPPDLTAPPADATKSATGLISKVITPGTSSEKPIATDIVTVNYTGWTSEGRMFDSSVVRGEPATFPLKGVIPGWTEGLQLMPVGSKYKFYIPSNLAYGENGPGPIGPNAMLTFDVELIKIMPPADAAKPAEPAKAEAAKK